MGLLAACASVGSSIAPAILWHVSQSFPQYAMYSKQPWKSVGPRFISAAALAAVGIWNHWDQCTGPGTTLRAVHISAAYPCLPVGQVGKTHTPCQLELQHGKKYRFSRLHSLQDEMNYVYCKWSWGDSTGGTGDTGARTVGGEEGSGSHAGTISWAAHLCHTDHTDNTTPSGLSFRSTTCPCKCNRTF